MSIHPDCLNLCRRGESETPCQVIGGCGYQWSPACVLCTTDLTDGHICPRCSHRIRNDLDQILQLVTDASAQVTHRKGSGKNSRASLGSRPPLIVEALDPELTLVRIVENDPSTDLPLLEILESWERVIREDRGLSPYGVASAERQSQYAGTPTQSALTGVVRFLQAHHDWVCAENSFDLIEYSRQIRLCRKAVARWDMTMEPPGWRVPCPTVTDDGDCGYVIKVQRGEQVAYCRRCDRDWEVHHLIAVAGRDADIWVDVEAAATLAGVHERTIRKWIQRGRISKRGQLVRVIDIREQALRWTAS